MERGGKKGRKSKVMSKNTRPRSIDRAKSVKYMDELLGITKLEVSDEENEKEEGSEQREVGISEWVNMSEQAVQDVACGKQVNVPVMKQNFNRTVNQQEDKVDPVRNIDDDNK